MRKPIYGKARRLPFAKIADDGDYRYKPMGIEVYNEKEYKKKMQSILLLQSAIMDSFIAIDEVFPKVLKSIIGRRDELHTRPWGSVGSASYENRGNGGIILLRISFRYRIPRGRSNDSVSSGVPDYYTRLCAQFLHEFGEYILAKYGNRDFDYQLPKVSGYSYSSSEAFCEAFAYLVIKRSNNPRWMRASLTNEPSGLKKMYDEIVERIIN